MSRKRSHKASMSIDNKSNPFTQHLFVGCLSLFLSDFLMRMTSKSMDKSMKIIMLNVDVYVCICWRWRSHRFWSQKTKLSYASFFSSVAWTIWRCSVAASNFIIVSKTPYTHFVLVRRQRPVNTFSIYRYVTHSHKERIPMLNAYN